MSTQKVNTTVTTTAVTQGPLARFLTTAGVIIAALTAAQPVIVQGLGLTATESGKISAAIAGVATVFAGLKSIAEHFGWIPVAGAQAITEGSTVAPKHVQTMVAS